MPETRVIVVTTAGEIRELELPEADHLAWIYGQLETGHVGRFPLWPPHDHGLGVQAFYDDTVQSAKKAVNWTFTAWLAAHFESLDKCINGNVLLAGFAGDDDLGGLDGTHHHVCLSQLISVRAQLRDMGVVSRDDSPPEAPAAGSADGWLGDTNAG